MQETQDQQSSPIELDSCLEAFTKEEHLADDEKYYCSKCRSHQLASKKLQIWRLPPILVSILYIQFYRVASGRENIGKSYQGINSRKTQGFFVVPEIEVFLERSSTNNHHF